MDRQVVLAWSDNTATVEIVNSGYSKSQDAMHLARSLFFIAAHFKLVIRAKHIRGKENVLADALSRNNLSFFFHNFPQANHLLTRIPQPVLEVLITSKPDWTSTNWAKLFSSTVTTH